MSQLISNYKKIKNLIKDIQNNLNQFQDKIQNLYSTNNSIHEFNLIKKIESIRDQKKLDKVFPRNSKSAKLNDLKSQIQFINNLSKSENSVANKAEEIDLTSLQAVKEMINNTEDDLTKESEVNLQDQNELLVNIMQEMKTIDKTKQLSDDAKNNNQDMVLTMDLLDSLKKSGKEIVENFVIADKKTKEEIADTLTLEFDEPVQNFESKQNFNKNDLISLLNKK
ncbi:MAG: hypothetical protein HUJ42_00240 [Malacoplasma sp.]|nr:hypothetical protein [Malacoplasma sp.]